MKMDFLKKLVPPGMEYKPELRFYITGLICAGLYSLSFFIRYFDARYELYEHYDYKSVLIDGAKIADFSSLLGYALVGFAFLAVCMLGFIVYHYLYYRQGSKSIYLMKRLPSKLELHKRAIALPLLAILGCLVAALIVMLLYFAVYMLATPKQCLLPNQWQKLWRL